MLHGPVKEKKKLIGIYVLNLHTDHRILSLSNFKDKKLRHKVVTQAESGRGSICTQLF